MTKAKLGLGVFLGVSVAMLAAPALAKAPTICVVHNNADHPSITALVNGMNDEAAIYGAKVTYFDPAYDPVKQVSMIEDCIASKADVIAVNAVDPAAVVPAIQKAKEAGIPVLMQNADTTPEGHAFTEAFIGSQSFDQGYAVGQMIVKALHGAGNVVVITGKAGQIDTVQRSAGMKAAFKNANAKINILAEQPADWSKDKALTVMQDMLTRFPKIDAVFGHDDPMALGALEAIKAQGLEGKIKVFGVNGNKEACAAVKSGEMSGTALQLSYLIGVYTVRAAYDLTNGRLIPKTILAPTAPVTAENVAKWNSQCW
ncbi:MAG TPA: sugar ABC transporter substrate-binding protein [Roseiarcus sp.]|jgi:ABC-type sugar transport system substrate-binding protein